MSVRIVSSTQPTPYAPVGWRPAGRIFWLLFYQGVALSRRTRIKPANCWQGAAREGGLGVSERQFIAVERAIEQFKEIKMSMLNILSAEDAAKYPVIELPPMIMDGPGGSGGCHGCEAYRPEPQLSGNLQCDPEIMLPSPGFDVLIGYYYNAQSTANGPFGLGRTISPNMTAQASGSPTLVTLTRGNGAQVSYAYNGSSYVAQTPGCLNSLVQDTTNGYWKETTLDGMLTAYPLNTTGMITSVAYQQDAPGNIHTHSYSSGLLQTIEDSVGRLVTFAYSGGLLSTIQDWANRLTTFQYDTASTAPLYLLTTVTGPTGCQTQYQHATFTQYSGGVITSACYPLRYIGPCRKWNKLSFTISRAALPTESYRALAFTPISTSPAPFSLDPMGSTVTQMTGGSFALSAAQNAVGGVTSYTRNANLQETSRQMPSGGIWTTNYNAAGLVSSSVSPLNLRTSYVYDSFNNLLSTQTPDGALWSTVWGYAGSPFDTTGAKCKPQATIDPLGNRVTMGYTGRGQLATVQDSLGFVTTHNFDSFGSEISYQDAMGFFWTTTRDLAGNAVAQMNPLGAIWSQTLDNQNRPLTTTDPLGNTSQVIPQFCGKCSGRHIASRFSHNLDV